MTAHMGDYLQELAAEMRANSEHWFPSTHKGDLPLPVFYALGLSGEVGEVANVVKKMVRDGDSEAKRADLASELADCFTYLLLLADEVGVDLVAEYREKELVNMARWGSRHGNYTWRTVPVGYYVHGSGTLVEKKPHASGFHVTFDRDRPFKERWSRYVAADDLVPVGIGRRGLAYAPRSLTTNKPSSVPPESA